VPAENEAALRAVGAGAAGLRGGVARDGVELVVVARVLAVRCGRARAGLGGRAASTVDSWTATAS